MNKNYNFNRIQLLSLASLIFLSPALRLFPNSAAEYASQAAAFSALAAIPLILLYLLFICRFMDFRKDGEGMAELIMRCLGPKAGKAALGILSLWFLFYAAFILRVGSDRLITTIYPHSSPALFIIVMALICSISALGAARTIVRAAKLLLPFIFGIIIFILLFASFSVSGKNLLPVSISDTLPIFISSLSSFDIFTAVLYLICFFAPFVKRSENSFKAYSIWVLFMSAFISWLCIAVVGSFGAELSAKLSWPFFSLVRNLVFFNSLERIEALVVSIWVFPDFLLVSMLLYSAQYCLRLSLGEKSPEYRGEKMFSTINKRFMIPLCGVFIIISGLFMAKSPENLEFFSKTLIPLINFAFALLFLPGIFIYGKTKNKL